MDWNGKSQLLKGVLEQPEVQVDEEIKLSFVERIEFIGEVFKERGGGIGSFQAFPVDPVPVRIIIYTDIL